MKLLEAAATITNLENFYERPKRKIIAYLGSTNSGKTYKAIQKFKESKNAIYLAPLRLLAREIYDTSKDLNIALITGEEKINPDNYTHIKYN